MTESEALQHHARGQELQLAGNHAEALPDFGLAAAWFAATEGEQSPDLANILMDQADSLLALCGYDEAEQTARRAAAIVSAIAPQLDAETRAHLLPAPSPC